MARFLDQFPLYDPLIRKDAHGKVSDRMSEQWVDFMATFMETLQGYLSQNGIFIPKVNLTQRNAITNPVDGQMIYNTTVDKFQGYENGAWVDFISSITPSLFPWNTVSVPATNMLVNNGYSCQYGGISMLILPLSSVVGDEIKIVSAAAGNTFLVVQNAGQQMQLGDVQTTVGVGGSIQSTARGDGLTLVCTVADTEWIAETAVGNPIIV